MSRGRRTIPAVAAFRPPFGHVFRVERSRGAQWYAKFRLPDGRQVQRRLGPAWTERGRPPAGYFTRRLADAWLRSTLDEARRGTLPGMVRTGATFADAAAEYLRYITDDRNRKASTVEDYRSIIDVHLLRYATAAFAGLRMGELRALRWRDVDFPRSVVRVRASYAAGELSVPTSGKVQSVPMVDEVAQRLAVLSKRDWFTGDDDLVFCEEAGAWLNDDRLRRRYETALRAAGLRRLGFHDLRHTFGSLAITRADIVEVQAWMGHADIQTTMRHLHYRDRGQAAERLADAFRGELPKTPRPTRRR